MNRMCRDIVIYNMVEWQEPNVIDSAIYPHPTLPARSESHTGFYYIFVIVLLLLFCLGWRFHEIAKRETLYRSLPLLAFGLATGFAGTDFIELDL